MKFQCDFQNPKSRARRLVTIDLTPDEVAASRAAEDPDIYAQAYALQHAYRQVPAGFLHESIRLLPVH
jgi:hypothetical protein